ncbi:GNAT family N-acetyltransferase [Corynebacterium choanae]|uniref:GNAT family N-acetyltransferase n=1 Tax=Corynebacterium choanae TaxID=1862358 RepID=UPI0013DD8A62
MGLFGQWFSRLIPRAEHVAGRIGPVTTSTGDVISLRPLALSDANWWCSTRLREEHRLRPVEPTAPQGWVAAHTPRAFYDRFVAVQAARRDGICNALVIEQNGTPVGEVTLGGIERGALQRCWIGYWVAEHATGCHVATIAVALATDIAFHQLGLHRVTATYLENNPASGRVLTRNGYREEGFLVANIHINGQWEDHFLMALTADEFDTTAIARLQEAGIVLPGVPSPGDDEETVTVDQ